ncbi:crotonase/enoyl-CoA hydratase family protein [Pseudomaricurvus sp. HS19]|uniref:crotonase/enoyl-CoA hydratase family protein n=1 Tax=Pseudomaricurvus sp. HS19 TaxID=2692626 RepID=UPI00136DE073|nr:crotonase/enoyl-CoA hydratase family protein [Pseudomaricurvus sp. HS19]MYM62093.1 crotonase/enoyl-CoA hydratase family protein [Pseudomaricurvus sp. HS19]
MAGKALKVEIKDRIALLTLCRPQAFNSMNADFWFELPRVIQDISDTASARVIVLASSGKHFCAGMDLAVFAGFAQGGESSEPGRRNETMVRALQQLQDVFTRLEQARVPVLAAIQGGCIGGALDMISACDMRYCTSDAFFCIEETKIGMTADLGTLQRLPSLLPQGLVREMAYTGRRLGAEEALRAGLVNRVYDTQEAMLEEVMEIAAEIAANSPLAVSGCKEMLNYARDHSVSDSLHTMTLWQGGMFQPQFDLQQAVAARQQKRAAEFQELNAVEFPIQPLPGPDGE